MLVFLRYGYKATKPRIQTQNIKSLNQFRKQMHEARVRLRKQNVINLHKIQDQFLQNHKKQMAETHFQNQCAFRSKIARNSYLMFKDIEKDKQMHEEKYKRMEKHIRTEQIKKINRSRIVKILQYESANYWTQNLSQKVISQRVLPEYIGSTQYYHKLHAQAIAYDELDFDLLHKLSNNEQTVKYKNKYLIPIYKQVIQLIRLVKFSDEDRAHKQLVESQINAKKRNTNEQKLKVELQKIKIEFQAKIQSINKKKIIPDEKRNYIKQKLRELILLLKKWKQYTDVLSMTSTQILKQIDENKNQSSIAEKRKIIEKQIEKKRDKTFFDPKQQDTEDQQITLASFLQKNQKPPNPLSPQKKQPENLDFNTELANLLKSQQAIFNQISEQIKQKQLQLQKQSKTKVNATSNVDKNITLQQQLEIDEGYLRPSQTTTGVQAMKEEFSNDKQIKNLLNIAGELTIQYPKLFRKVWESQIL